MPTQRKGYFLADGTRVPSVTTVLSARKEAGGLMHWAWEQGMVGKDYRQERDSAADAGTLGHALIEAYTRGQGPPADLEYTEKQRQQAQQALVSFRAWADGSRLEIIASEVPMVSERYRVGGTLDAVAMVNGERSIVDYKTGSVYAEALMQVAMYRELWNETHPDEPAGERIHILRVSRDTADFVHRSYLDLSDAVHNFVLLREVYELDKRLKKRVA